MGGPGRESSNTCTNSSTFLWSRVLLMSMRGRPYFLVRCRLFMWSFTLLHTKEWSVRVILMLERPTRLVRIKSSWCQCFDRGCLQETRCWGFVLKKVLLTHNPWWQQSSSRRWPFSFIFPMPNWPKQVGQELWSTPTLALKSPAMNSNSLSGILLMAALRSS